MEANGDDVERPISNPEHDPIPMSREAFKQLVAEANAGDQDALSRLRALLDDCPELWQRAGDLAAHAEVAMLDLIAGDNQFIRESLQRKLDELKAELRGDTPSVLEKLAVERITACWLWAQHADTLVAQATDVSRPQLALLLRRQSQSARQFQQAMKSLTDIRRLLPQQAARLKVFAGSPDTESVQPSELRIRRAE